ncbi:MAG TPA: polysaccharide pyruvyl transferase family protein, partial [Alphaproteobacteria bacterium]
MIKAYWHLANNVGDTLTQPILQHFTGQRVKLARRGAREKVLGVGSVMTALRARDVVFGTGCIRRGIVEAPEGVKFLAVRGPLTRAMIKGAKVPEVYGDPALLLPLMYPVRKEKKTHDLGLIPHHVDEKTQAFLDAKQTLEFLLGEEQVKVIDVRLPWPEFVVEVARCRRVISSSLHGLVIAEAYGVPAEWSEWSDRVIGKGFKFRDYFAATGRANEGPGPLKPIEPNLLQNIQEGLLR